jgi:hypothetical protein
VHRKAIVAGMRVASSSLAHALTEIRQPVATHSSRAITHMPIRKPTVKRRVGLVIG